MRDALIGPLREVFGISDKVLTMTLSGLLLAAPISKPFWTEVGGSLIAVDRLVHNFLRRTGILTRFASRHRFGPACYRSQGCADIIYAAAERIDTRQFNPAFPKIFPRLVQHAIWHYCSQAGLDVCNGNQIDDSKRCGKWDCKLRLLCDRIAIRL
jgi:hypothetical protein